MAAELGRVVILTTFDRDDYLFAGLRAGASGFLLKNAEAEQLVEAVRAVGRGHALLSPGGHPTCHRGDDRRAGDGRRVRRRTPGSSTGSPIASARCCSCWAQGLSNAEVAERLVVGEATVKTHVSNCLSKLHLRDRVQAVVFAHRVGLVG